MVERHRISRSRKIVILSECFGVSTDYLREDYIKEPDEVKPPTPKSVHPGGGPTPRLPGARGHSTSEPPVGHIQRHGMAAGDHCEHNRIDQRHQVNLTGLQIQPSGNNGTHGLHDEQAPGLHHAGAV